MTGLSSSCENMEQTAEFIYLLAILVFVMSALLVRQIPIGRGLQMFAGWVVIFLAAFVAFSMKDRVVEFASQVLDERKAESSGVQVGRDLHIKRSLDGHYWVDGMVNGTKLRFLIDSGATTTSLSTAAAERAGVERRGGFPALVQTANGTVTVQRGRVETLKVGEIVRDDMAVHVSDGFGDTNVLGMNFLSSLSGWGVEGTRLVLKP
jgi:aspartyl protease family protein